MDIQYCSDLHLEFPDNLRLMRERPLEPKAEILILGGDIVPFKHLKVVDWFFDYVSEHWKHVFWLPGNHEYYGSDMLDRSGAFIEKIRENVLLINNEIVEFHDLKLIFATMWTEISPRFAFDISSGVNDFHQIKVNKRKLTVETYNMMHLLSRDFIIGELAVPFEGKKVVITHHVPTFMNWQEKYKNSPLNEVFGVELFWFIEERGPDYWIYGHNHHNQAPFTIGYTTMLTNQMGYVKHGEDKAFDWGKLI